MQWDYGKMERDGVFRRTGTLNKPPRPLLNAVQSLKARHMLKDSEVNEHLAAMFAKYPKLANKFGHQGQEHDELFAGIRAGKPINNGEYMAKSTLLAIMGRMAAYTGQQVTWKMAMDSKEDLTPPKWDWDAKLAEPAVAIPGVTPFV